MKRRILLCIALCSAMLGAMAQRSYTFNAVALNVDGLPAEVSSIDINSGGPLSEGTKTLSSMIAQKDWGFVGLSEDFNFHTELMSSISHLYNSGTHRGTVTGTSNNTDGLGLLCSKQYTFSGESWTSWDKSDGSISDLIIGKITDSEYDNGVDELIDKGYRYYKITIVSGFEIDVYVLHMDAASRQDDIDARESQLKQLATAVKTNTGKNKRPVIILGDTNCRYTREKLKELLIDEINKDSRFTIKDAWIEHMWNGVYPTNGGDAMMTHTYGDQKGEVVDKVFYINTTESNLTLKANSYLHDTSIKVSDHYPVVVNFTLTDPNGSKPTEDNFTIDPNAGVEAPVYTGNKVSNGTTYYVKNVATGLYLKSGADYGTRAIEGSAGMAIKFTQSGNYWKLYTTETLGVLGQNDPFMDGTPGEWTLQQVSGTSYQYYIRRNTSDGEALSSTPDDKLGKLNCFTFNANDDKQKWVLLTESQMKTEMKNKANSNYPYDATPLFRAADFDRMDDEQGFYSKWSGADENTIGGIWWQGGDKYNGCAAIVNTTKSTSVSQTVSSMPAGYYKISFEGFYRSKKSDGSDETKTATLTVGGLTFNLAQNTATNISTDRLVPGEVFRDNDTYAQSGTFQLTSQGSITIKITNPSTTGSNWVCFDNIKLLYSTEPFSDPYIDFKNQVTNKVNETYPKVLKLNKEGQAAYDITTVIYRYENNLITSAEIANNLCTMVDNAYANAWEAHVAVIVAEAVGKMEANGGDVTGAIINPSFEMGDLTGWKVLGWGSDINVYPNSNETYTTNGCDGTYLFNSWNGDEGHGSHVKQTVKGIPNGLYELKASLASFSQTDGRTHNYHMFLFANGYNTSVEAKDNKKEFIETTLYFLVEDGSATIGAVGGNKGGGSTFIHYWPDEGCFLKADNFRLKRICDVPHGRLKLALDEAKATTLDAYGQAALDLSSYEAKYTNKSLSGDGTTEVEAIYTALQTATKAQRTMNADMTWAIENPGFETGDYRGWSTTAGWDTGAKLQEGIKGVYDVKVAGTKGRYLFNTWNNQDNTDKGTAHVNAHITQTVTGIPNGTYKLTAMLATDAGSNLSLTANGNTTTIAASGNGNTSGVFPEVTCEVTDGTLDIEAGGVDNVWYKCDDFHLTLLTPAELVLDENDEVIPAINNVVYPKVTFKRTIKPGTWSTFVAPFDIPRSMLGSDWEVKKLTSTEDNGERITLVFSDAENIEAGVPYMVRNQKLGENLTSFPMENVTVNTTALNNTAAGDITFVGVYTKGYVPQGSYFISSNVFYQAENGNSNTLKAFRAYLKPKDATKARSLGYRFMGSGNDEGTTAIDTPDGEPTVVGIYTLGGVRISDMQQGVNIVQMSDGTTIKVVIK